LRANEVRATAKLDSATPANKRVSVPVFRPARTTSSRAAASPPAMPPAATDHRPKEKASTAPKDADRRYADHAGVGQRVAQ